MSKDTLQLPKTAFSMKASLPTKEPEILKKVGKNKIFEKLRKNSKGKKNLYYMMDHLMQMVIFIWDCLNKILKDMITRFHQMSGKTQFMFQVGIAMDCQ